MSKWPIGGVALAALTAFGPAMAADLPVKSPVPNAPAVEDSWTGPYVGLAVGGKLAHTTWTATSTSDFPGTIIDASSPRNFDPAAARIGGYAGYSWQVASFVFGIEGDIAYANATTSSAGIPGCAISCFPGAFGPGVDTTSVKIAWDASLRARLGVLASPGVLFYGTGGVALQRVQTSGTCQHSLADPACTRAPGDPFDTQTNAKILTGWTIGGGIEAKVYGSWLLRAEYRYARFDRLHGLLPFGVPTPLAPLGTDFQRYDLSVDTHVAALGIAYQFGGPVVAKY
jgi:outer membrane immunogenic protein